MQILRICLCKVTVTVITLCCLTLCCLTLLGLIIHDVAARTALDLAGTVTVVLAEPAALAAAVVAPVLAAARLAFLFEFARAVEDTDAFSAAPFACALPTACATIGRRRSSPLGDFAVYLLGPAGKIEIRRK